MLLKRVKNKCCVAGVRFFFDYKTAITREIDDRIFLDAISLNENLKSSLKVDLARTHHNQYKKVLKDIGLKVITLPSDGFPDSVFIEDTAVVHGNKVLITTPGATSRRGEVTALNRLFINGEYKDKISVFHLLGGTMDGGDVLFTGKEFIIGLTSRTDRKGIESFSRIFNKYTVHAIDLKTLTKGSKEVLHLKSFTSMCGVNRLLVGGEIGLRFKEWVVNEANLSNSLDVVHVPDRDAANCVIVNQSIIRRSDEEFPNSAGILQSLVGSHGINKEYQLNGSELAKVDGALTCCSLLLSE